MAENESNNTLHYSSKRMWFYLFIGKIIRLKKFYIHPQICYEAIVKLLEKPTFLDNINKEKSVQDLILNDDENELERSEFILSIIKYCEKQISNDQMEEIIRMAEISPLFINNI